MKMKHFIFPNFLQIKIKVIKMTIPQELLDLKTAPENSIKDEAVELAKHYCDDDAYKLINGVLDKK